MDLRGVAGSYGRLVKLGVGVAAESGGRSATTGDQVPAVPVGDLQVHDPPVGEQQVGAQRGLPDGSDQTKK